ncbi:MAG: hypothetical protein IT210_02980 [Armatimonadetes bacterium]|nr:hypothetical protein [Armatimonadota bacterium]
MAYRIVSRDIGIMGTGSNMFRTGIAHSSGQVFVGTYGPPPAIVWKYRPDARHLEKVGAPGEYQLDSMVEAPNGKIYIGTAYNGLVYEIDPRTGRIKSLGSPPVDSTPWIFTMILTQGGEIYGAKGVGIFRLDWLTGKMESCGIVPGEHATPAPGSSSPIIRTLEERPDGLLWGDTNRWVFTFDPKSKKITPVADIAALDDACYAVIHGFGKAPVSDLYFQVYSRFSGRTPRHPFHKLRADTGKIEPLHIEGLQNPYWVSGWWNDRGQPRWLITEYDPETAASSVAVIDIEKRKVADRWAVDGIDTPPNRIAGPGLWFISTARGTLYRADPGKKRLEALAANPVPVECRSLAASAEGLLGTDTYDCGFVFTLNPRTGRQADHGRVWLDDHRCNYGPAAFAGDGGRYFLANHGEGMPALWATDIQRNRHWRIGESAAQLVRFRDGSVWGVQGPNPPTVEFDPAQCWTPVRVSAPGTLFRYPPGGKQVEVIAEAGPTGPIAESPAPTGRAFLADGDTIRLYDPDKKQTLARRKLPAAIIHLTADFARNKIYILLQGGRLFSCSETDLQPQERATGFGAAERGFFMLSRSGRLAGLSPDGTVSLFDPDQAILTHIKGQPPLPAGPAVDSHEDAWYFAGRSVMKYSLESGH